MMIIYNQDGLFKKSKINTDVDANQLFLRNHPDSACTWAFTDAAKSTPLQTQESKNPVSG